MMKSGTFIPLRKSGAAPGDGGTLSRGRLLYVPDARALLGNRKSAWWIKRNFAPQFRFKIGRDSVWYESDALSWLDAQREAR